MPTAKVNDPGSTIAACGPHRQARPATVTAAVVAALTAAIPLAPCAYADGVSQFIATVASMRSTSSCPQLVYNPIVEQAATIINRSTDTYLNQAAKAVPIADPLPVVYDVGYTGSKAIKLLGAGMNDADAIKSAVLGGLAIIPDCSYTDFGVSLLQNESSGYIVSTVVFAGP